MGDPDFVDFSSVVCPDTGVTAREAAVSAIIARDHLGAESIVPPNAATNVRRVALIEDVRVLTGVLAVELGSGPAPAGALDAARRARLVHEATMRSDSFALYAGLALVGLDEDSAPHSHHRDR